MLTPPNVADGGSLDGSFFVQDSVVSFHFGFFSKLVRVGCKSGRGCAEPVDFSPFVTGD
jgi:hypothetical protein